MPLGRQGRVFERMPSVFHENRAAESRGAQFSPAQKPSFDLWYNYSIFLRLLLVRYSNKRRENTLVTRQMVQSDKGSAVMITPTTDRLQRDKKTFKEKLVATRKG